MTLNLLLSPELEERLRQEAERRGVSPDDVTIELLHKHLLQDKRMVAQSARGHDAFLSGYTPEDEGLYDDLGR